MTCSDCGCNLLAVELFIQLERGVLCKKCFNRALYFDGAPDVNQMKFHGLSSVEESWLADEPPQWPDEIEDKEL